MNKTDKIIELIEQGYVDHKAFENDRWILEYRTFSVKLLNIGDEIMSELAKDHDIISFLTYLIRNGGIRFNSIIQCSSFICTE